MKNNAHKYFLHINGQTIDLNQIEGLSNMEDFLNLSIFTGLFKDEEELLCALISLGYQLESTDNHNIEIVKRVGNKKKGYTIKPITTDILYKKAFRFISTGTIQQLLYLNRTHVDMIRELLETYRKSVAKILEGLERKLERLEEELNYAPVEYKSDIRSEINSRKNSIKNFRSQENNIQAILALIGEKCSLEMISRVEESEYIDRLEEFVNKETMYYRGNKKSPNNRGLVRLAVRLSSIVSYYPDLKLPSPTRAHDEKRKKIVDAIKNSMTKSQLTDPTPIVQDDSDDDLQLDPDDYMFLTEEDFENQIRFATTQEQIESYEDTIENLRERQGQFSDEYAHRRIS